MSRYSIPNPDPRLGALPMLPSNPRNQHSRIHRSADNPALPSDASLLNLRLATPADLTAAEDVSKRAYLRLRDVYRPTAAATVRRDQGRQDYERLVGECNGRIVATLEYRSSSDSLHVRGLAVDPDDQGRGVGSVMIDEVVHVAHSMGLSTISLFTVRETGNVELFEHLGLRVVSEQVATWCKSDRYAHLHEVRMERAVL